MAYNRLCAGRDSSLVNIRVSRPYMFEFVIQVHFSKTNQVELELYNFISENLNHHNKVPRDLHLTCIIVRLFNRLILTFQVVFIPLVLEI